MIGSNSAANVVLVTGSGSLWYQTDNLIVGNAGRSNQLTISVGATVGGSVGLCAGVGVASSVGVGLGVAVGSGEGVGVSCTKTGSDEIADALGDAEGDDVLATSVGRPPKTLTTISSAMTVRPATRPPSSQSRRGGVLCNRRDRALCETPLCCWPAWGGGGCGAPLAMGSAA